MSDDGSQPAYQVLAGAPSSAVVLQVPHGSRALTGAVTALMVEIRRDTYMVEPGGPPTDGIHRLVTALANLVDAVGRLSTPKLIQQ